MFGQLHIYDGATMGFHCPFQGRLQMCPGGTRTQTTEATVDGNALLTDPQLVALLPGFIF